MINQLIQLPVVEVAVRVRFLELLNRVPYVVPLGQIRVHRLEVHLLQLLLELNRVVVKLLRPRVVEEVVHLNGRRVHQRSDLYPNPLPLHEREVAERLQIILLTL